MIKAVIFDVDGLMVDSTLIHREASQKFLEAHGKLHFDSGSGREGMRIIDIVEDYKDIYDLPEPIEELYAERQAIFFTLAREKLRLFPGVVELLQKLKQRNLKLAIATSGDRNYIDILFQKFPELRTYFTAVISSEDVIAGKPNPEVYIKAAQKLEAEPKYCVVLEDSFNGVLAAKQAGMQVICVPNPLYPDADYSKADRVFSSLTDVSQALPG